MNPRPPGYEPDELPNCSTPRRHAAPQWRRINYITVSSLCQWVSKKITADSENGLTCGQTRIILGIPSRSRPPGQRSVSGYDPFLFQMNRRTKTAEQAASSRMKRGKRGKTSNIRFSSFCKEPGTRRCIRHRLKRRREAPNRIPPGRKMRHRI